MVYNSLFLPLTGYKYQHILDVIWIVDEMFSFRQFLGILGSCMNTC